MTTGPRTKFGIDMLKTLTYLDLLIQNPENEKKTIGFPVGWCISHWENKQMP